MRRVTFLMSMVVALMLPTLAAATELVMVEEPGCVWCARWNDEIAPAYGKTAEGRFAPLRRVDIRTLPGELELDRRVAFTPTFLLVRKGRELARLEGYPGAHFFWPLLGQMLKKNTDYREPTK